MDHAHYVSFGGFHLTSILGYVGKSETQLIFVYITPRIVCSPESSGWAGALVYVSSDGLTDCTLPFLSFFVATSHRWS